MCSMCQDATHRFCMNILPGNQDRYSPPKKVGRYQFSLAASAHLYTLERVRRGAVSTHIRTADRELEMLLSPRTDAPGTSQNCPRGLLGACDAETSPWNSASTALTRPPPPTHYPSVLTTLPLGLRAPMGSNAHSGE